MTTNRRAEDFEKALSGKAAVDPTMASLVALAGALAAVPQQPAPAFRESLRAQLMAEAANLAAVPAASVPAASAPAASIPAQVAGGSLRSLVAKPALQAATGVLAATVAATGVGIGASRSLPGDTLYGLKRTVEGWQVALAGDAVAEADALVEQARTRLDEVRALLDRGTADALDQVLRTLDALKAQLDDATTALLAAARDGSRAAYDRLDAVVKDVNARILALLPELPAEARAAASASLGTLNVALAQLRALPVPPAGTPGVPSPGTTPTDLPTTTPTTPPVVVPTTPPVVVPTTPPVSPPVTTPPVVVTTPPVVVPTTPPVVVPTLPPITLPPL